MDLSPAIVRVSRAWKRRSVRRLAGQVPALPSRSEMPAEELALEWHRSRSRCSWRPGTVTAAPAGQAGR